MTFIFVENGGSENLADGSFRLKGQELLDEKGINLHRASQKGEFAYSTLRRYIKEPESIQAMSLRVLYKFLINGLKIPTAELSEMKFGDIFEVVPSSPEEETE